MREDLAHLSPQEIVCQLAPLRWESGCNLSALTLIGRQTFRREEGFEQSYLVSDINITFMHLFVFISFLLSIFYWLQWCGPCYWFVSSQECSKRRDRPRKRPPWWSICCLGELSTDSFEYSIRPITTNRWEWIVAATTSPPDRPSSRPKRPYWTSLLTLSVCTKW